MKKRAGRKRAQEFDDLPEAGAALDEAVEAVAEPAEDAAAEDEVFDDDLDLAAYESSLPEMEPEIRALWERYVTERGNELRDTLIQHYMPLVSQHAQRQAAKLPPSVELDDLVSAGTLGLIDAINKFDPFRGTKFETYCVRRITGAMLDELRRYDWVPRLIRNRGHKLDRARDELETRLKRKATREEMARHLDMSHEEYDDLLRELDVKAIYSLDRKWDDDDNNEIGHLDTLTDVRQKSPIDQLQRQEIKALAIRGLSQKEKEILQMYYYDHLSLKEIGAVLSISESRVCQIHQQTLELLREKFRSREVDVLD